MGSSYSGRFTTGDYKKAFMDEVTRLMDRTMTTPARILACSDLCESYTVQVGEVPDSGQLSRLAAFILRDTLQDHSPDKMRRDKYPVLSKRQEILRRYREISVGDKIEKASSDPRVTVGRAKEGRGRVNE